MRVLRCGGGSSCSGSSGGGGSGAGQGGQLLLCDVQLCVCIVQLAVEVLFGGSECECGCLEGVEGGGLGGVGE